VAIKDTEIEPEKSLDKKQLNKEDREISYLIAYRELVQYSKCSMIYINKQKGIDLISVYKEDYDRYAENPMKPSEVQIQHYQAYIDECMFLLIDDQEEYTEGYKRLSKRLNNITPETDEEIALSEAIEIDKKIKQISNQLYIEKSGYNKITEEQREANSKKRHALFDEIDIIRQRNNGNTTDEDLALIKQIYQQLSTIGKIENLEIDTEEIAFLENEYTKNALELKEFFKNNQTPDVFLIFSEHLLNERMGKFFFTEDLNNKLGIYDTMYIQTLNEIIVPFVACTLGYPCGPESYFSIEHCLDSVEPEAKACGKNVIDYFLDDLLSTNQMIDFNNYFNYLLDNHAKI